MSRYSPNAFKYNDRIALALLPSLVILGSYAGKVVSGILLAGAMVTYTMDTLRWREAAFASVWITLVASNIGFILSTIFRRQLSLMMLFGSMGLNGPTLLLTGLWGTIQFRWMLIQHPQLVLPIERLLLATALPVAVVIQSWGLMGAIGIELVPFSGMAIGCCLYALCMQPLPSSFQAPIRGPGSSSAHSSMLQIQGRFEGILSMAMICLLPTLMYLMSHLEVIFEPEHFWSVQLLWSIPVLFISLLPRGLWWMSQNPLALQYIRATLAVVSGVVALLALEGRVIFHSFSTYIPLSFPYNWITVSIFLFLKAGVAGAHCAGMLQTQLGFTLGSCFLVLSACAGGIAVGLPVVLMPAPLIGSAGLALFYDSGLLRDYIIFYFGTVSTFCWILWHHFWFLEISVGGVPLRNICQLIGISAVVAFLIPGLLITDAFDVFTTRALEGFLLSQAAAVTLLEERLFAGEHDEEAVLYPAYLVLFTSALGIWFTRRLVAREFVSDLVGWGLHCVYLSKLPMLLLPQAHLVFPSFCLFLAVTPPLLLLKPSQQQLASWKGCLLAGVVILAVVLSRMAIFDVVQAVISAHPPEGLLLGSLVLIAAAGCFPLYYRFYRRSAAARRWFALSIALGALLCFLRPPLPIRGMAACPQLPAGLCPRLWDERHVPNHEVDDLEMYGLGWTRREHWPLWLLISAVMTGLAAVTSGTPVQRSIRSRLLWGALGGLSVGCYLGLEFFPEQQILQILTIVSCVMGCGFLVLLQKPAGYGDSWMPFLISAWAALFPVSFFLQAEFSMPPIPDDMRRLFPDTPQLMETERERAGRAAVLAIYASQSLLIAFALKLKISRALKSGGSHVPGPPSGSWDPRIHSYTGSLGSASPSLRAFCSPGGLSAMFSTMVSPRVFNRVAGRMKMTGAAGLMLRRLAAEGLSWAPTVGNVITVFSFCLCLSLNSYFTDGKDIGIFAAVPVLLLLNQDPIFFRDLAEKRRYFPVAAALMGCLWFSSLSSIVQGGITRSLPYLGPPLALSHSLYVAWVADWMESSVGFLLRNVGGLLASLPSLLSFLRFLWVHDQLGSSLTSLMTLPLNLVPLLLSDISFILDLGLLGLLGSIVLAVVYSQLRLMGQRLI